MTKFYFTTSESQTNEVYDLLLKDSNEKFIELEKERFSRLNAKEQSEPKNAINYKKKLNNFYLWGGSNSSTIFSVDDYSIIQKIIDNGYEIKIRHTPYSLEFYGDVYQYDIDLKKWILLTETIKNNYDTKEQIVAFIICNGYTKVSEKIFSDAENMKKVVVSYKEK